MINLASKFDNLSHALFLKLFGYAGADAEKVVAHVNVSIIVGLIASKLPFWWGIGLMAAYLIVFVVVREYIEGKWQAKDKTISDVITKSIGLGLFFWR